MLPQTPAAPFARRASRRTPLRRWRAAQRVAGAALIVGAALAWAFVLGGGNTRFLIVPFAVAATAPALWSRHAALSIAPRAALWATAAWGGVLSFLGRAHDSDHLRFVALAVVAVAGLLSLGRFARAIGGMRPLLVALVALSAADAGISALFAAGLALGRRSDDGHVLAMFVAIALLNIAGLFVILRRRRLWAHVVASIVIVALNVVDVAQLHEFRWLLAGTAAVQLALACLQRLPPASPRVRRNVERAIRVGLVAFAAIVVSTQLWR